MSYTTLISAEQLQALVASAKPLRIFDCTFDLMKPHAGQEQYLASHIPGAVYANLDTALSAKHGVPGAHGVITASGADARRQRIFSHDFGEQRLFWGNQVLIQFGGCNRRRHEKLPFRWGQRGGAAV